MQESCNSSRPLCICSKNMTTDQLLRHMRQNLQLDHFELAYHSLEPEKGRRLCMTGICRQCGQRLCYGVELPEHEAPERLLAAMKLSFSTVLVAAPGGEVLTYWESGHPDEYDIWELITRDARYRKAAELLEESVEVRVSHYIYETESPGPDAHAEQSHFDLLDAYNELARRHRRSRFEHREDVSKVRTFSLHLEL